MKGLWAALWAESLKLRRSKMIWVTIMLFVFVAVMMGFLMLVAKHPELAGKSAVISTKASLVSSADWPSFFNLLLQLILTFGSLGFGIATSWIFGREFADRVAKDLLALPVSRSTMILSKFIILAFWCLVLSFVMFLSGIIAGKIVNLYGWSGSAFHAFILAYAGSSLLTILLCTPVAFIASIGRGYLLPIGFTILMLILTQFIFVGVPGFTPCFPWAIPALFSGVAGQGLPLPGIYGYIGLFLASFLGLAATLAWWSLADQK